MMKVYVPTDKPSLLASRLISKKLEVNGFKPIQGDVTSLLAALPKGAGVYVPYLPFWRSDDPLKGLYAGASGLGKFPAGPFAAAPAPQNVTPVAPAMPARIAASASGPPAKRVPIAGFTRPSWSVAKGWRAAAFGRSVATKGVGVMLLTQNTTQAQVATPLITAGIQPDTANSMANAALTFIHSHGFTALTVGFTVAGGVAAIDSFIRPGRERKRRYDLYAAAGAIAAILFYFLISSPSPFAGTWTLDATQSRYESGDPPREASCKIEEKGSSLAVSEDSVLSDGKPAHISYQLELDGKDHPAPKVTAADTIAATLTKNILETILRKGGQIVSRETRVLSADQKLMTVTIAGVKPTKQEFKNITVYEKKK